MLRLLFKEPKVLTEDFVLIIVPFQSQANLVPKKELILFQKVID